MALWILWTLPAVVLILIWFAILSFFDPENLPRAVDDDPKLAAYTAQLAGTDKRKEDKHGSTNGARDSSWSNRSEDRVIRAGSSADPGTATRQSHGRAVSGSPGTKDADPKVSETTGGSAQENESQGNAIAQYALAGSDSARSPSNGNDSTPMDPAQDHWDSDPYGDDPLDRSLSISGQTVSEDGNPVSGIEVVATARRLFDEEQAQLDYFGGPVEKRTASDVAGYFQFSGLPNGEYQISTVATDYYPIVVSTVSRAGVDALKLVVVEQREIWINGFVTTPEGEPLDEVEISAYSSPEPVDVSGLSGDFAFTLAVRSDRGELISFRADGYQAKKVPIAPRDWHNGQPVELEVVMQPEKVLTVVSGALLSKAGDPIAGEQVYLKQNQQKYKAVSDQSGKFVIENVESGGNYALWLMPAGPFQKYRQNGVKVPPEGLKGLEIVLEPTGVGAVTGQMMDPQGNPIPNFTLAVRSQSSRTAPLPVTSDEQGYFVVENVPEGQLRFESGSFPRFVVSGIQLAAGDEIDVDLVINLGAEQIAGQVTDDQGNPVAAASITLSWVLRENPLVHESLRKTTSGPDGHFQFTQLGTGMHMIIVRAAGYEGAQIEEEVGGVYGSGGNVDVRLAQLTE